MTGCGDGAIIHWSPRIQITSRDQVQECRLFSIHCRSFYGSELWGCSSSGFMRNNTEWNKAARRVLQVYLYAHMGGCLVHGQSHITVHLHCKIVRYIHHVITHTNPIANMIGNHARVSLCYFTDVCQYDISAFQIWH